MNSLYQKYLELKRKYPGVLFLFRCGDFYETYDEDARIASKVLGITLAKRNSWPSEMIGFPFHALDDYLPKLVRKSNKNGGKYGYWQVAIAEPLEKENQANKDKETIKQEYKIELKRYENEITPKEALDSHRDFWVKKWQGNDYYPITHYVWREEYQQYDSRWKKYNQFEPSTWPPKKIYDFMLSILEHNSCIITFDEMSDTKHYDNK